MLKISKRSADKYRSLKSLHTGHTDNLVIETPKKKIWVSRVELDASGLALVSREEVIFTAEGQCWRIVATS